MTAAALEVSLPNPDALFAEWTDLKTQEPRLRIRDAAARLGVAEAQLVALGCGVRATRLQGPFEEIYKRLPELGKVMCLTRNEGAVHERRGVFGDLDVENGHVGLIVGDDIDLRLFFRFYQSAFALREPVGTGTEITIRRSLQFFDPTGTAAQKIYLEDPAGIEAFDAIAQDFASQNQSRAQEVKPPSPRRPERPDEEVDVQAIREVWRNMKDTHDFFPMLMKHRLTRTQALRLAGTQWAKPLSNDTTRALLEGASASGLPIMCFVGSAGCIQIHTGPVEKIKVMGPWLNVLDPIFNLHLREDLIASTWVVRKPTVDGVVTSVEIFDADGENTALFFGKRKPGIAEDENWRAFVAELEAR